MDGGAIACWVDERDGTPFLYAGRLTGTGTVAPGWNEGGNPVCLVPAQRLLSSVVADGSGGAIVVWNDDRSGTQDIYAQRIAGSFLTSTEVSLESVESFIDHVRLTGYWPGGSGEPLGIQRREGRSAWTEVGETMVGGTGRATFVDRDVTVGHCYGYRATPRNDLTSMPTAEAPACIPTGLELALDGSVPNPAVDELVVSFELPNGDAAKLELMDVSGRRMESRDVSSLGAGRHLLSFGEPLRPRGTAESGPGAGSAEVDPNPAHRRRG